MVEGYEKFKRRIQRSSEEAILRRLSTQYTFQLSDYLVQLQTLKKRAERRERRDLNNLISRPSTSTDESEDEEENVFHDDFPPPGKSGDNIQSDAGITLAPAVEVVEPEPEKEKDPDNSGKSPLSKSLDDIIHVVKNSHQGEGIHSNKIEIRIKSLEDSLNSITKLCSDISQKLDIVVDNSSTNSSRITVVENRVDELDRNTKFYVDSKINSVLNKSLLDPPPHPSQRSQETPIDLLRKEVKSLKRKQLSDERAISLISETIANVKDQFDSTLEDSRQAQDDFSHASRSRQNRDNERILMHESIESSAKLIRQLIANNVSIHSELNTIKKSNDDIKKVNAYVKSCQDSLMKYVTFSNFDHNLVSSVKNLLDQANNWILQVEIIYSTSEAHAIGNSKGDTSNIGIFTDNADKTVYEFLDEIEIGLLGWGTTRQRAAQLYNRHLSEDIKSRTLDCSDNFIELKKWLIKEFGAPSRIIGDIITDLKSKPSPSNDSPKSRYIFYSNFGKSVARLDKLIRVSSIDVDELDSALYSRSTLSDLINILPPEDLNHLRRQMVKKKLDWKNPTGIVYFAFLKEFIDTEWDLLGPYKDVSHPSKPKSTHFIDTQLQSSFNINVPPPLPDPKKTLV